jgi:hypothetical protein
MTITISNTTEIVVADGVPCRVWEGQTESGVKVQCLIVRIATFASGTDLAQFEAELEEAAAPSAEVQAFPLRMIL